MSDSTVSWTIGGRSYSRIGSNPPMVIAPANRFQSFILNLCDQFKRMGCLKSRTQPSVGEAGSEEIVKVMNMVIEISPGAYETVMYETKDSTSSDNNSEGDLHIQFKEGSLAAILLSQEPAFINLNFPKLNEVIESISSCEDEDEENSLDGEAEGQIQDFAGNSCSVTRVRADISVFTSGRATLSIGSKVFGLAMAAKPKIRQKVLHVDFVNHRSRLGLIRYYIDVSPQEVVTDEMEL